MYASKGVLHKSTEHVSDEFVEDFLLSEAPDCDPAVHTEKSRFSSRISFVDPVRYGKLDKMPLNSLINLERSEIWFGTIQCQVSTFPKHSA